MHLAYQLSRKAWALEKTGNAAHAIHTCREAEAHYEYLARVTDSEFLQADVVLMRGAALTVRLGTGDGSAAEELKRTIWKLREMESRFDRPEIDVECRRFETANLSGRS